MQAAFGQAEAACGVFFLYWRITPHYEPALYFRWQSKQYTLPWKRALLFQQKSATFWLTVFLQSAQNRRIDLAGSAVAEGGAGCFWGMEKQPCTLKLHG